MCEELNKALAFARESGMTVTEYHDRGEVILAYPCGDEEVIRVNDPRADRRVLDMTIRML